jgi:hypothetical protein
VRIDLYKATYLFIYVVDGLGWELGEN